MRKILGSNNILYLKHDDARGRKKGSLRVTSPLWLELPHRGHFSLILATRARITFFPLLLLQQQSRALSEGSTSICVHASL